MPFPLVEDRNFNLSNESSLWNEVITAEDHYVSTIVRNRSRLVYKRAVQSIIVSVIRFP